jgi:hypothetical protein
LRRSAVEVSIEKYEKTAIQWLKKQTRGEKGIELFIERILKWQDFQEQNQK